MKAKELKRAFKNSVVIPALARAPSRREVVHVLHVAKTGGTAMEAALPLESALHRLVTPSHTLFFRNHEIWLRHIPRGQKVVFGVRDPAKRFVSGFYSRLRGGQFGRKVRDYEKAAFETFATPRDLARALSSEDPKLKRAADDAISSILHTRVRLSDWTGTAEALAQRADDVLYVYQQETLSADFAALQELLNLPKTALPSDDTQAHKLGGGFDTALDDLARANLRAWYAEDYRVIEACQKLFVGDGRMTAREAPAIAV